MPWLIAARVDEVAEGKPRIVTLAGKEIGVFLEGGRHFAVLNFCPHAGAPVCLGKVAGCVVAAGPGQLDYDHERRVLRCPWHHWEFDLETGRALAPTREKIKTYPVRVCGEEILIDV